MAGGGEAAIGPRDEEEPVPGPSGLGQARGIAAPREETGSPAPDGEGEGGGEPGLRRAPTRGAQRRALLAAALLSRGALFRHLWPLSLPWRGSKGAAPTGGEENVAKERGEEAAVPDEAGGSPVAEKMDEDVGEGEVLPPEDEEMNMLKGIALGDEDERSGWARARRLGKSKSPHLPPGCLMYPACRHRPLIETTAKVKGRVKARQPIRAA